MWLTGLAMNRPTRLHKLVTPPDKRSASWRTGILQAVVVALFGLFFLFPFDPDRGPAGLSYDLLYLFRQLCIQFIFFLIQFIELRF